MSILRQILVDRGVDSEDLEAFKEALVDAAVLVRRAGLEHLVEDATLAEVQALADAGDKLIAERAVLLLTTFMAPATAVAPYDGGASQRREVVQTALALADSGVSNGG